MKPPCTILLPLDDGGSQSLIDAAGLPDLLPVDLPQFHIGRNRLNGARKL
jgi:hypothetical protein